MRTTLQLRYAVGASRVIAGNPVEGFDRGLEHLSRWTDRRRGHVELRVDDAFTNTLHETIGAPSPCPAVDEFHELWPDVLDDLANAGTSVGRNSYGGWDDADRGLARTIWCLCRHLRPAAVLETGVGRGLTTRVILEALERNQHGRLWSVDRPPLAAGLADQTGIAVDQPLRARWTLLRGSSRRCLPALLDGLKQLDVPIELFIHDSLHTARNLRFELESVWPRLSSRGVVVADDINRNMAFNVFAERHAGSCATVTRADDGLATFGCLFKRSND